MPKWKSKDAKWGGKDAKSGKEYPRRLLGRDQPLQIDWRATRFNRRGTRLILDGGPRSAPIDMFARAGPDDAPRLAAYDATVIGTATIDTTINPRPEPTGPVTLAPA
jgi:hypothetical protein